jgi:hypothetical protein
LLSMGFLLIGLHPIAQAGGNNYSPQVIVPGFGIGPAKLGMTQAQIRRALKAAHLTRSWCNVDVLISDGHVSALGTSFGGCITLRLRSSALRATLTNGIPMPEVSGIGGSPVPLVRAFGEPRRFPVDPPIVILLWPNGLAARTTIAEGGEMITYLAVVPINSVVPPYPVLIPRQRKWGNHVSHKGMRPGDRTSKPLSKNTSRPASSPGAISRMAKSYCLRRCPRFADGIWLDLVRSANQQCNTHPEDDPVRWPADKVIRRERSMRAAVIEGTRRPVVVRDMPIRPRR